jgi:hypothetical protein
MRARERMTHEETDKTPVLCNGKDKYFRLKERQSQNGRLARAVTPRVGRGGRDIEGEGMRGWMAWSDRTNGVDMWTTKR